MAAKVSDGFCMVERQHQRDGQSDIVQKLYRPLHVERAVGLDAVIDIAEGVDDLFQAIRRRESSWCERSFACGGNFCYKLSFWNEIETYV